MFINIKTIIKIKTQTLCIKTALPNLSDLMSCVSWLTVTEIPPYSETELNIQYFDYLIAL